MFISTIELLGWEKVDSGLWFVASAKKANLGREKN
jgi:hypothetical protein